MTETIPLKGACVWTGAEMRSSARWVREFPPAVLDAIDAAVAKVKDVDWSCVNRTNFPLPGAQAYFVDVRE